MAHETMTFRLAGKNGAPHATMLSLIAVQGGIRGPIDRSQPRRFGRQGFAAACSEPGALHGSGASRNPPGGARQVAPEHVPQGAPERHAGRRRRRRLCAAAGEGPQGPAVSLLLDTSIVSELRKGERANSRVRAWFESVNEFEIHLSVLSVGEIRRGIERVRAKDPKQATAVDRWLQRLTREHADRILPVDRRVT